MRRRNPFLLHNKRYIEQAHLSLLLREESQKNTRRSESPCFEPFTSSRPYECRDRHAGRAARRYDGIRLSSGLYTNMPHAMATMSWNQRVKPRDQSDYSSYFAAYRDAKLFRTDSYMFSRRRTEAARQSQVFVEV